MHYVLPRHYLRRSLRDDQLYGERETDSAGNNLDLLNKPSLPSQDPWIFALGFGGGTDFRLSSRALAERRSGLGRVHRQSSGLYCPVLGTVRRRVDGQIAAIEVTEVLYGCADFE